MKDEYIAGIFIFGGILILASFVMFVARGIRKNYLLEDEESGDIWTGNKITYPNGTTIDDYTKGGDVIDSNIQEGEIAVHTIFTDSNE